MLRKLKLYGELADFIGHKEFTIQAHDLSRVMSFLINNFEGVEKYMNPRYYQVKVGNYTIDKTEILDPIGEEDIHIVPVIAGAGGRGGLGKILLGAALIGGTIMAGGGFGAMEIFGGEGLVFGSKLGKVIAGVTMNLGVGLTIMGVSEMLFPLPKPKEFKSEQDPQLSFSFSGTQNTSRAGTPVPIVYGEIVTGSVVVSAAIDTNQVEA